MKQEELEELLDSFDPGERRAALNELVATCRDVCAPEGTNVNMHCHSFFSYNAEGFSPSRVVWEAKKAGFHAVGLCDFDVLDGLEEFLQAGLTAGVRATVNLETRVFFKEYADAEITSPGEPGVTYIMGAGFAREPAEGSSQAEGLAGYRSGARDRNAELIARINAHLPDLALDYDADVLPLTPSGAATERHIVSAYLQKAKTVCEHPAKTAERLSRILGRSEEACLELLTDTPRLEEQLRSKLAKRGGVGYKAPSEDTFPPVDAFVAWVASCGAIPMITWLDGTSEGEKDPGRMLDCMMAKGCAALNIVPDRNWNVADPQVRAVKIANLKAVVEAAEARSLPINIGTEMNKLGLPFVDDLQGEALHPYQDIFIRGARIMVGHTLLARYAGLSYCGAEAAERFADVREKNGFFERVGTLAPMGVDEAQRLEDMGREKALAWFEDAVAP